MTGSKTTRRNAVAVAISSILHVLFFYFVVTYVPQPPPEPEIIVQPLDVSVMPMPQIPPPPPEVIIPPKLIPKKIETLPETRPIPTPPPPKPEPPKPEPPKPTPAPPKPTPPTPPSPTLSPPKPVAPKISPLPAPTVSAARPSPAPPAPQSAPKTPTPATQVSPSPSPVVTLNKLNLHKPEKATPTGVPTLPVAPSGGPQGSAAAAALAGAAFAPQGSRLSGLNPYPYGAMPSGGSGLRGTLVGCANASAVGLSSVEKAHCNERFGVQIGHAPALDGINPAKRAAFDAAAERQERDRNSRGADPIAAVHNAQPRSPSEPDINSGPTSFQH